METKEIIKLSVLDLVNFTMQRGDISAGFASSSRMTDAIKAHQVIQKLGGESYTAELPITFRVDTVDIALEINGRIDGVIKTGDGIIIDEIKTTTRSLKEIEEDYNPLHTAQAKCYGYIYGTQNCLDSIGIQMTYYNIDTRETKNFLTHHSMEELHDFFYGLVESYAAWAGVIKNWGREKDDSIAGLDFPFPTYRKGQRELAIKVYRTIRDSGKVFIQAPTGTGKTIASLYPAIKALGEGLVSKIFYLTAKTTTRTVVEKAFDNMKEKGLRLKTLTITAKEKICFKEEAVCDPETCEYARGYYDRVKSAVEDIFTLDSYTRETIEDYGRKHCVCPFEFSLDLSLWADCIICDYNYAFDPRVYLKRFFLEGRGDYCFLIDEAHNLVDRCREMFSAQLFKKDILELQRSARHVYKGIHKSSKDINSYMIKMRKVCEANDGSLVQKEEPNELYNLLRIFTDISEEYLQKSPDSAFRTQVLECYFAVSAFLRAAENYDERFVTFFEKNGSDLGVKIFCIDPSKVMKKCLKRGKSAVFFSATLTPLDYFIEILGGDENTQKLRLASPFDRENLCLLGDYRTSTRYRMRESTYEKIADSILKVAEGRKGNYIAYFPSYKYMGEVFNIFAEKNPGIKTICQRSGMTEEEREGFLSLFKADNSQTVVGFAVMGGVLYL